MDKASGEARTFQLSQSQAVLLLAGRGPRGKLCPLPEVPAGRGSPEDLSLLQSAGLLDGHGHPTGEWADVARALADPRLQMLAVVGGAEGITHLAAYTDPVLAPRLAACGPHGPGECTLAWPVQPDDMLALLTGALGLDAHTADVGIRFELGAEAFLLLAAFLDALREQELDALLRRAQPAPPRAGEAAVTLALRAGLAADDSRWLVPVFKRLLPVPPQADDAAVERGLAELAKASVVARDGRGGDVALLPAFQPVRLRLQAPLAWGTLAAVADTGGLRRWTQLGALRTLGALWGIESDKGRVRLATVEEGHLLAGLRAVFDAGFAATAASPATARFCGKCGGPLASGAKFCGRCGARVT